VGLTGTDAVMLVSCRSETSEIPAFFTVYRYRNKMVCEEIVVSETFCYATHCSVMLWSLLMFFLPLSGEYRHYVLGSVGLSVSAFVHLLPNLWTQCFENENQFWCKSAKIVHETVAWNAQLFGSWGQSSRSLEAKIGQQNTFQRDFSRTARRILTKPSRHISW